MEMNRNRNRNRNDKKLGNSSQYNEACYRACFGNDLLGSLTKYENKTNGAYKKRGQETCIQVHWILNKM